MRGNETKAPFSAASANQRDGGPERPAREAEKGGQVASRYCPRCSARLESRKCKLICPCCGYYMSCSDFY